VPRGFFQIRCWAAGRKRNSEECPLSGHGKTKVNMTAAKTKCKALGRTSGRTELAGQARQLDQEIREAVNAVQSSLSEVGALLARMKDSRLWASTRPIHGMIT